MPCDVYTLEGQIVFSFQKIQKNESPKAGDYFDFCGGGKNSSVWFKLGISPLPPPQEERLLKYSNAVLAHTHMHLGAYFCLPLSSGEIAYTKLTD